MVVTSVVTYTFPIGPFLGAPSSRYGPSVDWGVLRVVLLRQFSLYEDRLCVRQIQIPCDGPEAKLLNNFQYHQESQ